MARVKGSRSAAIEGDSAPNGDHQSVLDRLESPVGKSEGRKSEGMIIIPAPNIVTVSIRIIGTMPLICNAFPNKVLMEFEEKKGKVQEAAIKGKKPHPARDFQKEFQDSLYPIDGGGYGFPAIAFKQAMVGACRHVEGLTMEQAKRFIFVRSDSRSRGCNVVRIDGEPTMQRDMVRLSNQERTPDVRFRGVFFPWSCVLRIDYNGNRLTHRGILNLLQYAGLFEGVGENRPSSPRKTGDHGTFRIPDEMEESL